MGDEIDKMKDWNFDDKREKLLQFVKEISVVYDKTIDKHHLTFTFNLPLVGDSILYKNIMSKKDGYKIKEGKDSMMVEYLQDNSRTFKTDKKKVELMREFIIVYFLTDCLVHSLPLIVLIFLSLR